MPLLAFIPGLILPALVGWLLLDLLEGNTRVLWRGEKWVLGFVVGLTFSMFCAFVGNVAVGIPFTLTGFLTVLGVLVVTLGAVWWMRRRGGTLERHTVTPTGMTVSRPYGTMIGDPVSRRMTIILGILGGWVALRVIVFWIVSLLTPTFFDDAMDNWNLRAKVFYYSGKFTLPFPWDSNPGVSSYPPTVPLSKTWLSTIAGSWNDGLVNGMHGIWFAALLLLLYWSLRRMLPMGWALLGPMILASLPLELIHGTSPYADVFLSLHLFIAVIFLFHALTTRTQECVLPFLRISGFAIALLPFTKNEGWALYFPVVLLLAAGTLLWLTRRGLLSRQQMLRTGTLAVICIAAVVLPWIGFKITQGLAFGNAKGIDWHLHWQQNVLLSIAVNTFFEGNWGLLFPLFFGLLIVRWRAAFRMPLLLLTLCFLLPYGVQFFAYLFTGLSTEAILQTGYARGLIQLMPVVVTLTVLLLHEVISGTKGTEATNDFS